ncbi:hypothetical protein [Streptomyces sp. NPDC058486]|uniref:hypothetical protein n=1 Tax=unclassified Streptomyces TaxID=2593676 RepID=UPI003659E10E
MRPTPAEALLDALGEVPWARLESAVEDFPPKEMRRALRRLVLKGGAATEDDCYDLFDCFAPGAGRVASVETAALPFVVALARDPESGARATLVELLASLARGAERADPARVDAGWREAWRLQRPRIRALLADPVPEVRREALPLAEGAGELLERWYAETDPTVRVPLLIRLGAAATGSGMVDRVRAVVAEALRAEEPLMRLAAVHAWSAFDPRAAVRELDVLVEVLSDRAVRPQFEVVWYLPDYEVPLPHETVVSLTAALFEDAPQGALTFVLRLADAARRNGDTALCRAALDAGWRLLVRRPSAESALAPLAGALLSDPDEGVRYRAAHLLAVLGERAAPYADELAALVDDPGADEFFEGAVGDHARWALTRIGDPRALPGLVARLCAPYQGQFSRGYVITEPRLPEVEHVLLPLRAHAEALLPEVRRMLRDDGAGGWLTPCFLEILAAWGPAAAPALPEVVPLLEDARYAQSALTTLAAMGPAAASATPAVRRCAVLDSPAGQRHVAWAVRCLSGDGEESPSLTDGPEPSASGLEEDLRRFADGGDDYGAFVRALSGLARIGTVSPAARAALRTVRGRDRRLSADPDYQAVLWDEKNRAAIDDLLALP